VCAGRGKREAGTAAGRKEIGRLQRKRWQRTHIEKKRPSEKKTLGGRLLKGRRKQGKKEKKGKNVKRTCTPGGDGGNSLPSMGEGETTQKKKGLVGNKVTLTKKMRISE